jgi:vitamin B12 transporter
MKLKNIFYSILLTALSSTFLIAQNGVVSKTDSSGVYKLSDVVISATKTNMNTLELANSITVIDSSEISSRGKINVFELLKTEYGVSYTTQGPIGTLSNISIRGGNSGNTVVLVDGIKMNLTSDPSNVYDFANLTTDQISRIEILRGPQSLLYGSDALSGVVNIITKKGNGKPSVSLLAEGGSYNSFKGALGITGSTNKFNYTLSLSRTKSDGFSAAGEKYGNTEKDGYEGNNFSTRLGYDFSNNSYINLYLRFIKTDADYDQHGGEFGDDPTYKYNQEEFVSRVEGGFKLFDGLWDQKIGFSYLKNVRKYNYDSTLNNPSSSRSLYDGKRFTVDWLNNFNITDDHKLIFGFDAETEQAATQFFLNSAFGPFESIISESKATIFGFYLQDQLKLGNSFFATSGIRYDNHDKFGPAVTYRFAPAYIFWQTGTKLKATIGTGFKAPSIFYLYDPFFGNENLDPERSIGWDAGVEQFFFQQSISFGVTYFHNNFTDLIGLDDNFKSINIDEAETKGIEVFLNVNATSNLKIKTNYTFLETEDKSEGSPDKNMPLLRRPKHKAALITTYRFLERGDITMEIIYVGKRDDKDFSTFPAARVTMADYTVVNFAAQFDVTDWIMINGRIENIFDKDYEEVLGYATYGFSGTIGVKVNL